VCVEAFHEAAEIFPIQIGIYDNPAEVSALAWQGVHGIIVRDEEEDKIGS
jgi:hypothetical protein